MKKALYTFAVILIGVYILFSLLDRRGEYVVEQKIWRAHKKFASIAKDPKVVPDSAFDNVAAEYQSVINEYPDSPVIPNAYLLLGRVYMLKKDYGVAREKFEKVVEKYTKYLDVCAEAVSLIGNSYELEGDGQSAIVAYRRIVNNYPMTAIGMNTPLYIASLYSRLGNAQTASLEFAKVVTYYKEITQKNPNTLLGMNSIKLLASTYFVQKKWREGVETLGRLLHEYAKPQFLTVSRLTIILRTINTVSVTQLKDFDLAIQIYQTFVKNNPDNPLNGIMNNMINQLQELKKKGIVSPSETSP